MNTNFIRGLLYEMKKDYGSFIKFIRIDQSDLIIETGARDYIKTAFDIPVVVLPRKLNRKFIQDIGYLAANKNFTYGALNDYTEIKFIILGDDIPKGLDLNLDGYLIYANERYEKTEYSLLVENIAFGLSAKKAEGGKPYDITKLLPKNGLQFQQRVTYELN